MGRKFPPKGYRMDEYPLPHNFFQRVYLHMEDETKNSTIITILRTSEVATNAETIEVNPTNANFAEDTGPLIHNGSIVPRINLTLQMGLSKGGVETDKLRSIRIKWMPLYISFLNSLEAEDTRTAVQVEDILELQHDTTNKDTYPLFANATLAGTTHPVSTIPATEVFGDYGLTTDLVPEAVAFDEELFFDAMQYYTNHSMLRKVTGPMRTVTLTRDRQYTYHSNNFTNPSVKRGNPYTFCGILIHLPQASAKGVLVSSLDVTDIDHVYIDLMVRYDEWNPNFDQNRY